MDVVGYCIIKKDAKSGIGTKLNTFLGETCRVIEFAEDGGVLIINRTADSIATFDKEDILKSFKCEIKGGFILPPNLNQFQKVAYITKLHTRKGGYSELLAQMVIQSSLHKGIYHDDFLFQIEKEESNQHYND